MLKQWELKDLEAASGRVVDVRSFWKALQREVALLADNKADMAIEELVDYVGRLCGSIMKRSGDDRLMITGPLWIVRYECKL